MALLSPSSQSNRYNSQFVNFVDLLFVKLGDQITTLSDKDKMIQFMKWANATVTDGSSGNLDELVDEDYREFLERRIDSSDIPIYLADTSLGGNQAINSWYQYGPDDDIRHDNLMGRVYRKNIESNKQLLHLSFGLPHLNNLVSFYNNAVLGKIQGQQAGRLGSSDQDFEDISLIRSAVHTVVEIAKVSYDALFSIVFPTQSGETATPINKYYEMRPEMELYSRHVNSIMIRLAIAMGIFESTDSGETDDSDVFPANSLPRPFEETGLDLSLIRSRRFKLARNLGRDHHGSINLSDSGSDLDPLPTDKSLENLKNKVENDEITIDNRTNFGNNTIGSAATDGNPSSLSDDLLFVKNYWEQFTTVREGTITRGLEFLSFKIDADVNTSESFSNSTTTSTVSELLAGVADSIRDVYFTAGLHNRSELSESLEELGLGVVTNITDPDTDVGRAAAEIFFDGNRIVIPKLWADSEYSSSHSFKLTLRTMYGDPYSIFQDIYVPLACILAGTLPRAVGLNAYTQPFYVRAYVDGMTSIPLGIIDNLTIERGSDHFGFNKDFLPLSLDVSFTIKDLSPNMIMAPNVGRGITSPIAESTEAAYQAFARVDNELTEYIGTLGGLTPFDRLNRTKRISRASKLFRAAWRDNFLNPSRLGGEFFKNTNPFRGWLVRFSGGAGLPGGTRE